MKNFNVIASNPNKKGGFVTKIQHSVVSDDVFGMRHQETYYVSGTKQVAVGTVISLDVDKFRIATYPYVPDTTTGEVINLKWLHLK